MKIKNYLMRVEAFPEQGGAVSFDFLLRDASQKIDYYGTNRINK